MESSVVGGVSVKFKFLLTESGRLLRRTPSSVEEFSNGSWGKLVHTLFGAELMDSTVLSEEEARLYMEKLKESD